MSGGANFSPQLIVNGKRPFDRYKPASQVIPEIVLRYMLSPFFPMIVAIVMKPLYQASVLRWSHSELWGLGEGGFLAMGLVAPSIFTNIVAHGFYALIEHKGWLEQYKIERHECQLPSRALILSTLKFLLVSNCISKPLLSYFVLHPFLKRIGCPDFDAPLPSCLMLYVTFMLAIFCTDFGFYWTHRAFHTKLLYRFHKRHHEWHGNSSIAAEYCHPLETFATNIVPTFLGCILMRSHFLTLFAWFFTRLLKGYETHSGYAFCFPWLHLFGVVNWDNAVAHDYHHSSNSGNFGIYWIDWMFGTMDSFMVKGGLEKYVESKRLGNCLYPRLLSSMRTQAVSKAE